MWHDRFACLIKFKTRRCEFYSFYNKNCCRKNGINVKTIERQLDMPNISQTVKLKKL